MPMMGGGTGIPGGFGGYRPTGGGGGILKVFGGGGVWGRVSRSSFEEKGRQEEVNTRLSRRKVWKWVH